jgi:hypothetical protein
LKIEINHWEISETVRSKISSLCNDMASTRDRTQRIASDHLTTNCCNERERESKKTEKIFAVVFCDFTSLWHSHTGISWWKQGIWASQLCTSKFMSYLVFFSISGLNFWDEPGAVQLRDGQKWRLSIIVIRQKISWWKNLTDRDSYNVLKPGVNFSFSFSKLIKICWFNLRLCWFIVLCYLLASQSYWTLKHYFVFIVD